MEILEKDRQTTLWGILLYFWPYNMRYGFRYMLYIISQITLVTVSGVIIPLYIRQFIDALSLNASIGILHQILIGIGIWSLISVFCGIAADYFITNVAPLIMRDVENDCFDHIHSLSYHFFANSHVGSLVAKVKRFSSAYNMLDLHITRGLLSLIVLIVATVIVVSGFSWLIAGVFLGWGIFYVICILAVVQKKMNLDVIRVRLDSKTSGHLADSLTNFLTVKIFSGLGSERTLFRLFTQDVADATKRSWYASIFITAMQSFIVAGASVLILFLALGLWQQDRLSLGTVVLLQTYVFIIGSHFMQLGDQLKSIYRAAADAVEMMDILALRPSVRDPLVPTLLKMREGAVEIDNITFAYHDNRPVFDGLTLHIPAGQRIGIVGYSGAGKSTLVNLMLRFMDARSGSINIDGQDIRSVMQDELHACISYVPQEPLLFHRSIRENIHYGRPDATKEEIEHAARSAYAHEFIIHLPHGYDTIVGERGIRLSGGERQRIAIARAMLKNAPILILDEATSSLDSVSEHFIQQAFDSLLSRRTAIVIAHRLSTIQKMDRIIVLDKGMIIEDGHHEELLKKNGVYAELWRHQSNGFIGT